MALRRSLAQWPRIEAPDDLETLLSRAEYHGLAGVVADALVATRPRSDSRERLREVARDMDHQAHLAALHAIDRAFAGAGLVGVPLKGALFAERYYPRPSARVAADTDLLIRETDIKPAIQALEALGYRGEGSAEEDRYRRDHHHLHLSSDSSLPLELHFHAYRGFGRTLYSEPLIERSLRYRDFDALRHLAPDDEVVYLAVHGAAHRFGRWSWLFDLRLLIESLDEQTLASAGRRARQVGYARPVALAADLLVRVMGMAPERLTPLGELGPLRSELIDRLLCPPEKSVASSLSRLTYTTALCSDSATSLRWVGREAMRRTRGELSKLVRRFA